MKELLYEKICLIISHKLDKVKGDDYNKERFKSLSIYTDYVLYTIYGESDLKEILDLQCFKYWDDEITDSSISFSDYYWSRFDNYIEELKDYFYTNVDSIHTFNENDIRVLNDFYKEERRKDIIKEVIKKII